MKKKFLGTILAVLTLALLVPLTAVMIHRAAPSPAGEPALSENASLLISGTYETDGEDGEPDTTPLPGDEDYFQLLRADGSHYGYYATLQDLATDAGSETFGETSFTARMLKDFTTTAKATISLANTTWTLDGAGYTYTYTKSGYAITTYATEMDITIKDLTLKANAGGLQLGLNVPMTATFDNVKIYGGDSANKLTASGIALLVKGDSTIVTIKGAESLFKAGKGVAVENHGQLTVEDGSFFTNGGDAVIDTFNETVTADGAVSNPSTVIRGGTFVGGSGNSCYSVLRAYRGASVYVEGGNFLFASTVAARNAAKANMLRAGDKAGFIFISGGRFYNLYTLSPIIGASAAQYAYFRITGGEFYSLHEGDAALFTDTTGDSATTFSGLPITMIETKFGVAIPSYYTVTSETGEYAKTAEDMAISADLFAVSDTTFTEYAAIAPDADAPEFAPENQVLEVEDAAGNSEIFYLCEADRALRAVPNGGTLWIRSDFVLNTALVTPIRADSFTYTIAGKGGVKTLSTNVEGGYMIYVNGGALTMKNLTLNDGAGGLLAVLTSSACKGMLTLQNVKLAATGGTALCVGGALTFGDGVSVSATNGSAVELADGASFDLPSTETLFVNSQNATDAALLVSGDNCTYTVSGKLRAAGNAVALLVSGSNTTGTIKKQAQVAGGDNYAIFLDNSKSADGTLLNIEGGTFTSVSGTRTFQFSHGKNSVVNIYDGNFSMADTPNTSTRMIWQNVDQTTNIMGGTFNAKAGGQYLFGASKGTVNISGGTFNGATGVVLAFFEGSATLNIRETKDESGNVLASPRFNGSQGKMIFSLNASAVTVNIDGGTFTCANPSGYLFNVGCKLTVNDGNFSCYGGDIYRIRANTNLTVNGGTYFTTMHYSYAASGASTVVFNGGDVTLQGGGSFFRFRESTATQTTVNGGTYRVNGTGCFIYSSGESTEPGNKNALLVINGGTFDAYSTNAAFWAVKSSSTVFGAYLNVTVNGGTFTQRGAGQMFAYFAGSRGVVELHGGRFVSYGCAFQIDDGATGSLLIDGTTEIISLSSSAILLSDATKTAFAITINGGTLKGRDYVLRQQSPATVSGDTRAVTTINGGTFMPSQKNALIAAVSMTNGILVINDGRFASDGAAVIEVAGGSVHHDSGRILSYASAQAYVNGGTFTLLANGARKNTADAVLKCGTASGYGTVNVTGGVFVNNRKVSDQVMLLGNVVSDLTVSDATMLAGGKQTYYINLDGGAASVSVDENDPTLTFGDYTYSCNVECTLDTADAVYAITAPATEGALTFSVTVDADTMAGLNELATATPGSTLSYGVLVLTEDVADAAVMTREMLAVFEVPYTDLAVADEDAVTDGDGNLTATATLTGIDAADYETKYIGVGYAKIAWEGGERYFVTTDDTAAARSLCELATAMLEDVSDEADETYQYASVLYEEKFSPYDAAYQAILQTYLPASLVETSEV